VELPRHGGQLHPRFVAGDPREVLLREATRHEADLLAVGTRGHGGLLRLLLGSVSEAIVREATGDVLVVRHPPARHQ
jgi:nucleotide-binding universal stress UspA family protein